MGCSTSATLFVLSVSFASWIDSSNGNCGVSGDCGVFGLIQNSVANISNTSTNLSVSQCGPNCGAIGQAQNVSLSFNSANVSTTANVSSSYFGVVGYLALNASNFTNVSITGLVNVSSADVGNFTTKVTSSPSTGLFIY